jgi:hypothetical protein
MDYLPSGVMLSPLVILPYVAVITFASEECFGLVYMCQRVPEKNGTVARDREVLNFVTCTIHGLCYCGHCIMRKLETGITGDLHSMHVTCTGWLSTEADGSFPTLPYQYSIVHSPTLEVSLDSSGCLFTIPHAFTVLCHLRRTCLFYFVFL